MIHVAPLVEEAKVWRFLLRRRLNVLARRAPSASFFKSVARLRADTVEAFPAPSEADSDGLLAIGGDLRPERLLAAYGQGIFPWYVPGRPILWYSPDPRFVLDVRERHVPHNVRRLIRKRTLELRLDTAFEQVIDACAQAPRGAPRQARGDGRQTWITPQMRTSYVELHRLGYAHSAELWRGDELVAGCYGLALGAAFFGESMFTRVSDGSKMAVVLFAEWLERRGIFLHDCQLHSPHLEQLGAKSVSRDDFLKTLGEALRVPSCVGRWEVTAGPS
jgi:leucyl/phenylalanyl-tRNA---protein transferase